MFKPEMKSRMVASKLAFEETFMKMDSSDTSPNAYTGISFNYPAHWASNNSDQKMIGLRSLRVTPSSHVMRFLVTVYDSNVDPSVITMRTFLWSITEFNTLEEFLKVLTDTELYDTEEDPAPLEKPILRYTYNSTTGSLELTCVDVASSIASYYFEINDPDADPANPNKTDKQKYPNLYSFLRFLNQEETQANREILTTNSNTKIYQGVWNRQSLYFHSTFSNSHRGIIGRNNDFWHKPSKKYPYSTSTNNFTIHFTTDGTTRIFPLHCDFYIDLSFILNFERTIV